jgi:diguanylate cyclase (GGDEF)-like protein/PAS domain S-box-containing protein
MHGEVDPRSLTVMVADVLLWANSVDGALREAASAIGDAFPGHGVVAQLPDGSIAAANAAAGDLLGLTLDQLVGRTSMDPRWSAVSEQGIPLTGAEHPAMVTLATGREVTGFLMGVMSPLIGRTRWIEIDSHPVKAEDGSGSAETSRLVGVVAVFTDATDSARGLAASDAQWRAYQIVVMNTTDVLFRTDPTACVEWASLAASRVLGWTPSDIVGRPLIDVIHADDHDAFRDALARLESPERSADLEYRMERVGGGWRWVSDAVSTVVGDDLVVTGQIHALRDIDVEVAVRAALAESEARYRLIAENAADVIVTIVDGVITWASPSVTRTLGFQPAECTGQRFESFLLPDERATTIDPADLEPSSGRHVGRFRVRTKEGTSRWVEVHTSSYVGSDDRAGSLVVTLHVIDERVAFEDQLEDLAKRDGLTGAWNRNEGLLRLEAATRPDRRAGEAVAVAFIDVDDFKSVNDTHGHRAGDDLLVSIVSRTQSRMRRGDALVRMGGDEFLLVLSGTQSLEEAVDLLEQLRAVIAEPVSTGAGVVKATVSIGVTLVDDGEGIDACIARADSAMYEAKAEGRNRVVASLP